MKDKVKSALNKGVSNAVDNAGTVSVSFVAGSVVGTAWLPEVIQWALKLVGAG